MNLTEARNTLGVKNNSSEEEIKKAYKSLAIKWHPDRHSDEKKKEAEEKFAKISQAYDIICNPEKASGPNFHGGRHQGGEWNRKKQYDPMEHGEDVLCNVKITLEEAVQGSKKKVKLKKPFVCKPCDGLGLKKGKKRSECPSCNGSGVVTIRQRMFGGEFHARHNCPTCQGVGSLINSENACESCKGKKTVNKYTDVDLDIPSGVRTGMRLGSNGLGGEGVAGGPNGRLFIDIEVEEHKLYEIEEDTNDLNIVYNISYGQHYNGDTIEIRTIYGDKIDVKIPPQHNTIDPIIKPGYGLPGMPTDQEE